MGRYKRKKGRIKTLKRFTNVDMILNFIRINMDKLIEIPISKFGIKKIYIDEYEDPSHEENGFQYHTPIFGTINSCLIHNSFYPYLTK